MARLPDLQQAASSNSLALRPAHLAASAASSYRAAEASSRCLQLHPERISCPWARQAFWLLLGVSTTIASPPCICRTAPRTCPFDHFISAASASPAADAALLLTLAPSGALKRLPGSKSHEPLIATVLSARAQRLERDRFPSPHMSDLAAAD